MQSVWLRFDALHQLIERFLHNRLIVICVAVLYAYFLMDLPLDIFKDREYYFAYTRNAEYLLDSNFYEGFLKFFSNEPVWLLLNVSLGDFLTPKEIVQSIIFFPAFLIAYMLLSIRRYSFFIILFILFMPQVIKNHIIHLRQGFAISIFLLGWLSYKKRFFWLIYITPFIHSSFFFILLIYFFSEIQRKFNINLIACLLIYFSIGLLVGVTFNELAGMFGARQAVPEGIAASGSTGLAFVFWVLVLCLMLSEGRYFVSRNIFQIGTLIFYLATYFLAGITGRVFESAMLLIVLSGLDLSVWRKYVFTFMLVIYTAVLYLKVIDEPWFGFVESDPLLYWVCPVDLC